jgi:hypothetical protein
MLSISHRPVKRRTQESETENQSGGGDSYLWRTRIFSIALRRMDKKAQFRNKAVSRESMVTINRKKIVLSVFIQKLPDQSLFHFYHTPEGDPLTMGAFLVTFSEFLLVSFIKNLAAPIN